MITTAGKTEFVNLLGNLNSPAEWGYIAVGNGTTAAAVGDTTLENELYRASATVSIESVLSPHDSLMFLGKSTATGSATISEIGIFNASENGDLLCRSILSTYKTVVSGADVIVLYYVTLKSGSAGSGSGY